MPNAWMIADTLQSDIAPRVRDALNITDSLDLRLFKNDHTPTLDDSLGNYVECDFDGYARIAFLDGTWQSPSLANHVYTISYPTPFIYDVTATPSPTQTVYGYYVVRENAELYWSERFETPRVLALNDSITLEAKFRYTVLPST